MYRLYLNTGWQFRQFHPLSVNRQVVETEVGWLPATVPGCVHKDLLENEKIPDPFLALNEKEVQWVGESDWLYRLDFTVAPEFLRQPHVDICFAGLDTFATIRLNGEKILESDNMFQPYRLPVRDFLKEGQNRLDILFESALKRGRALEDKYGKRPVWNTDSCRVYVRKAQYHFGWDWGPVLVTAGVWREVWLEAYQARIDSIYCPVQISEDLQRAVLPVTVEVVNPARIDTLIRVSLFSPQNELLEEQPGNSPEFSFNLESPNLWYPKAYGAQPLYRLVVSLEKDGLTLDQKEQKFGLRKIELLQEPLENEEGTTFTFQINNIPIFCGGANWIPGDSFQTRVTPQRYREWLELAAEANFNMLRVWGGGIYEADIFYELCDEMGLLVWQDFMFACGIYPAHPEFLLNVQAEVAANLKRLRHHPSIVLWCGNNEDYSIAQENKLYDSRFNGDFSQTGFPARELYERLLPEVCRELDPPRPYWPGSPYGGSDVDDQTRGDRHTWDVWHRQMAPYQKYPQFYGRFVSEFGMQGAPFLSTLKEFCPSEELYPESRTLEFHNKAPDGYRRLAVYLSDNLKMYGGLEDYIYKTQFVQAEALFCAIRGWRRLWQGHRVSGALLWQLNDCWPGISWSIVDFYLRPKAAYYTVKRALAPILLGLVSEAGSVVCWCACALQGKFTGSLEIAIWNLEGNQVSKHTFEMEINPNNITDLASLSVSQGELVYSARLLVNDAVVVRASLWPEPFKYQTFANPGVEVLTLDSDNIRLRVRRPVKGLWLDDGERRTWSDNFLDVFPDDPQTIYAPGVEVENIKLRWLE